MSAFFLISLIIVSGLCQETTLIETSDSTTPTADPTTTIADPTTTTIITTIISTSESTPLITTSTKETTPMETSFNVTFLTNDTASNATTITPGDINSMVATISVIGTLVTAIAIIVGFLLKNITQKKELEGKLYAVAADNVTLRDNIKLMQGKLASTEKADASANDDDIKIVLDGNDGGDEK